LLANRPERRASWRSDFNCMSRGVCGGVQVLLPAPLKALKTLRFRGFSLLKIVGRHVTTAHKLMLRVCLCFSI